MIFFKFIYQWIHIWPLSQGPISSAKDFVTFNTVLVKPKKLAMVSYYSDPAEVTDEFLV